MGIETFPPAEEGDEAFKTWLLTLPFPFQSLWNHLAKRSLPLCPEVWV